MTFSNTPFRLPPLSPLQSYCCAAKPNDSPAAALCLQDQRRAGVIIERAIATLEDGEDFDDVNIDPAHAMTFSRHLQSNSTLDLAELRLRSQSKCFTTTNSRKSLSPSRSRENLLSVLERSIADLDEQDFEDCDDINIDTIDWGRSSHHRNYDSHSEQ
jgi:hypothetical protein